MVSEPTRGVNVLDFFLTSNHTLVDYIKISPGIADHDIAVANVKVKPRISKQVPPKSSPVQKSKLDIYMDKKKSEILDNFHQESVKEIWTTLKLLFKRVFSQFVSIKKVGSK